MSKIVYYCESDSNNSVGMDLVHWLNTKFMATFNTRKTAHKWLVERFHYLKERCATEIECIKKHDNYFNLDTTITLDLYKFKVDDDFDIEVDNVWECDYDHELIDSRYLCGRY